MKEFKIFESEVVESILDLCKTNEQVAIVGGHYILLYEKLTDSLKPAVFEDFPEGGNKVFSKTRSQNFPLKSFLLSIRLHEQGRMKKINSKFVLVVNDDIFQKKDFRTKEHFEIVKDRGFELRRKYYNLPFEDSLPKSFLKELYKKNIKLNDTFFQFQYPNSTESYLPNKSIYVSERRLCKKFKKTAKSLLQIDKIFSSESDLESTEIDHLSTNETTESICLIEDGICNCGGKAYQFYLDLATSGFKTIIFFVPNDCSYFVNKGADLFVHSQLGKKNIIQIINISNLESDPESESVNKKITISLFKT